MGRKLDLTGKLSRGSTAAARKTRRIRTYDDYIINPAKGNFEAKPAQYMMSSLEKFSSGVLLPPCPPFTVLMRIFLLHIMMSEACTFIFTVSLTSCQCVPCH
jgi:hypothetical protein